MNEEVGAVNSHDEEANREHQLIEVEDLNEQVRVLEEEVTRARAEMEL